jgi:hypothetical protein
MQFSNVIDYPSRPIEVIWAAGSAGGVAIDSNGVIFAAAVALNN